MRIRKILSDIKAVLLLPVFLVIFLFYLIIAWIFKDTII